MANKTRSPYRYDRINPHTKIARRVQPEHNSYFLSLPDDQTIPISQLLANCITILMDSIACNNFYIIMGKTRDGCNFTFSLKDGDSKDDIFSCYKPNFPELVMELNSQILEFAETDEEEGEEPF